MNLRVESAESGTGGGGRTLRTRFPFVHLHTELSFPLSFPSMRVWYLRPEGFPPIFFFLARPRFPGFFPLRRGRHFVTEFREKEAN